MIDSDLRKVISSNCQTIGGAMIQHFIQVSNVGAEDPIRYAMGLLYPIGERIHIDRDFELSVIQETIHRNAVALQCSPYAFFEGRESRKEINAWLHARAWSQIDPDFCRLRSSVMDEFYRCYLDDDFRHVSFFEDYVLSKKKPTVDQLVRMPMAREGKLVNSKGWVSYLSKLIGMFFSAFRETESFSGRRYRRFVREVGGGWYFGLEVDVADIRAALDQGLQAPIGVEVVLFDGSLKGKDNKPINWLNQDLSSNITMWSINNIILPFRLPLDVDVKRASEREFLYFRLWLLSRILTPVLDLMIVAIDNSVRDVHV